MAYGLAPARRVLDNGATVLVKESRVTPAITMLASMTAGSAFDPPDRDGLAHFVSRTIDRGTETLSAEQIADALDGRGVSLGLGINRHVAHVECTCLAEDLGDLLPIVADILTCPSFPDDQVAMRRREIVTTIRQDEDNPGAVATERLLRLLFGGRHPYGRRLRGAVGSVDEIDRRALATFHRAHYHPGGLTLVLVGDIEAARAVDAAERVFGTWPAHGVPPLAVPPPAVSVTRRVDIVPMMNKAQADIAYGFAAVRRGDPEYHTYALLNNILGEYALGGRLGDSIRERQGMAYYVLSQLEASVAVGPLMVRAGVNPANVERAVASIDEELRRFAAEGPTEQEVTESKQYLIGSVPRKLETNAAIAHFLHAAEFFGLGPDYDVRMPALLQEITRDQVHAAAQRLLDPARATVVVAGPYQGTLA